MIPNKQQTCLISSLFLLDSFCRFSSREKFEESIVPWERDTPACQCGVEFGMVTNRKVFCRLCGCVGYGTGCATHAQCGHMHAPRVLRRDVAASDRAVPRPGPALGPADGYGAFSSWQAWPSHATPYHWCVWYWCVIVARYHAIDASLQCMRGYCAGGRPAGPGSVSYARVRADSAGAASPHRCSASLTCCGRRKTRWTISWLR